MSKKQNDGGDTIVELKDKDGGFTDPVTGFDISRDQQVPLTSPVGMRTEQALASGGLLIVGGGQSAAEESATETTEEEETGPEIDEEESAKSGKSRKGK